MVEIIKKTKEVVTVGTEKVSAMFDKVKDVKIIKGGKD